MSMNNLLSQVKPGTTATITKVSVTGVIAQRLTDMGIIVGDSIRVTKVSPFGDPIEVKVKNYHLSLRKSEAQYIHVTEYSI
jgi:ferrous iron transport protein A